MQGMRRVPTTANTHWPHPHKEAGSTKQTKATRSSHRSMPSSLANRSSSLYCGLSPCSRPLRRTSICGAWEGRRAAVSRIICRHHAAARDDKQQLQQLATFTSGSQQQPVPRAAAATNFKGRASSLPQSRTSCACGARPPWDGQAPPLRPPPPGPPSPPGCPATAGSGVWWV